MKKDPTRSVLAVWATLGVLFTPAMWYLYLRGDYEPSGFMLVALTLCAVLLAFLLLDAPNAEARLFWGVMLCSAIVGIMSKLQIFALLARHHDLLQCIRVTAHAVFGAAFLIAHMCAPFTLFGKRTEAFFKKRGLQIGDSGDSTRNS